MAKSRTGLSGAAGKQSALKKLRSALSTAGLTGPKSHVSKRDKKRGVAKGNAKHEERRQKLKAIQSAMNPFEMKVNRKKLDVLGLKRKDEQVNVAAARQRAVEKRKSTIGVERKNRNRAGGIIDRRIGENDPTMDPEEKMLQRFTLEKQNRARNASMYNLEDNSDVEGQITSLTHFGQSLNDMEDLNDLGASGDEDDSGAIDRDAVASGHFGGFEKPGDDEPPRKKTKAEVMQEVIAKSKMHKHERQMIKEQDDEIRRELDGDFESVRALLFADNDADNDGDAGELSKPMMKAAGTSDKDEDEAKRKKKDLADANYDAYVRELVFEQRARPQDRLKTEEEQAREEKERLERAERHRQRRMEGLPSDTENESDDDDDDELGAYKTKNKRAPVADDLGDDFAPAGSDDEDVAHSAVNGVNLGHGLGAETSEDEGEDDDEDDEEGSDSEEEGDEESDEESDEGSDLDQSGAETDSDEEDHSKPKSKESQKKAKLAAQRAAKNKSTSSDELPFTFAAPADYDAWLELVGEYSLEQQLVIIKRLRTLYHIRLSPQNKEKLSNLCIVLVEHLAVLAEQNPPVPVSVIDEIVKHVGELASIDQERFGEHCRQFVIDCHRRILGAIKNSVSPASAATKRVGPASIETGIRASDIALMRMFVSVFSSSDRYHAVITPMLVAICQFLSQYVFTTLKDISSGLVLLGIIHETQRLSRRFVPEVLNFLFATLSATVCETDDASDWDGQFPLSRRQREAYSILTIDPSQKCKSAASPIQWSWLTSDGAVDGDEQLSAEIKYGVLRACLMLCRRYIDCYFSASAFAECFTPLQSILAKVSERVSLAEKKGNLPSEISTVLSDLRGYLDEQLEQSLAARAPLKLQYHRPLAITTVAPKFESNYNLDTHYDPNRDRNEILKLRRQVNREKRGAVRELRRDAQFIAGERLKEIREKDKAYADKMKKAWGILETEQSEMKKMDRMRIKERKGKLE
ncbi:nucleolar complex protein 14 [Dipsacomyces acuminosporus]|nr:nucleolar complex protein 14 [Dipsacomyces acuminosporus]